MSSNKLPDTAVVRVALISDTHLSCDPDGSGPLYRRRLDAVIASVNDSGVDLVLFAGDLTDRALPEDIAMALEQMRQFTAPVLYVAGNHDVGEKLSVGGANPITEASLGAYTSGEARIGAAFFVERFHGLRVIGVTASLFNSGLSREEAQWAFLEEQMRTQTVETTVLLTHYPPFVEMPNDLPDQWNIDPAPRNRLLTLLQQGGVGAVLSGHTHHPRSHQHEGILFVTSPAVSFGLPWGQQPEGWTKLTLSADTNVAAFRYISVKAIGDD